MNPIEEGLFDAKGYCVYCSGWNMSDNGSTACVHTADCRGVKILAYLKKCQENAEGLIKEYEEIFTPEELKKEADDAMQLYMSEFKLPALPDSDEISKRGKDVFSVGLMRQYAWVCIRAFIDWRK